MARTRQIESQEKMDVLVICRTFALMSGVAAHVPMCAIDRTRLSPRKLARAWPRPYGRVAAKLREAGGTACLA
jgi:hypothetical protein